MNKKYYTCITLSILLLFCVVEVLAQDSPRVDSRLNVPQITNKDALLLPTLMVDQFTVTKETKLGTVLRSLARLADVNIAFGETVENLGPFRFHLNNPTPWNQLLESILNVYHLSYEVRGGIISILTIDDVNRIYAMEKQKNDQMMLELDRQKMNPLMVEVVNIKYAKADSLVPALNMILGKDDNRDEKREEGGTNNSITADKGNNKIVIHATYLEIQKIKDLIAQIDIQTQQIRIEANLVEVSSSFAKELGVRWAFQAQKSLDSSPAFPGASEPLESYEPAVVGPLDFNESGTFELPASTYNSMKGIIDTSAGLVDYGIISKNFALGMNLTALEDDGKIKILSRPSVTTVDNQKAVIKSGSDIPYQTTDEEGQPVVEYKEAVLSLDVLPHIIDDQAIFMDVAITKDEPDFSQTVQGNPVVLKKFVQSRMMVLDGQTAVIGGLTKNSDFSSEAGIPYLKDIPLIGKLFRSKSKQQDDEELMIFLTPRIVPQEAIDNSTMVEEWMKKHYHEIDKEKSNPDELPAETEQFLDSLQKKETKAAPEMNQDVEIPATISEEIESATGSENENG